jgi:hypothetical protein
MGGFMETRFKDKILICVDCKEEFVFTASAQDYFAGKGYTEDPKRCKSCYMELKKSKRRLAVESPRGHFEAEEPEEEFNIKDDSSIGNSAKESDLE